MGEVRCPCGAQADVWQVGEDRTKSLVDADSFLDCCAELKKREAEGGAPLQKHECRNLQLAIREEAERLVGG